MRRRSTPLPFRPISPLRDFLATEASAGVLIVAGAALALSWANSPWRASYHRLWETTAGLHVGGVRLELDLRHLVNDGLMTLFFFVVGLEIARELADGQLAERRAATLPVVAAAGGMVAPALLYLLFNTGGPGSGGWGVPVATDIALAVGLLSLLGGRVPVGLKVFLVALAIADDIGAVLIIAVVYSGGLSWGYLGLAVAALAAALAARRWGTQSYGPYVLAGLACWYGLYRAGVHPTLAGVAFGLATPTTPAERAEAFDAEELVGEDELAQVATAQRVAQAARRTVSVVEWLEHRWHPWASKVVAPLFAVANAGITVGGGALGGAATSRVTLGVVVGLVVGKPLGITAAAWLACRARLTALPEGVGWPALAAVGGVAGVGFTVSLFVTELAFSDQELADQARIGVLAASLLAAAIGLAGLLLVSRSMARPTRDPGARPGEGPGDESSSVSPGTPAPRPGR